MTLFVSSTLPELQVLFSGLKLIPEQMIDGEQVSQNQYIFAMGSCPHGTAGILFSRDTVQGISHTII
jgi:hypothetical protein